MKKFTICMTVFLMSFSASGAYADSPIFIDRVKSAFSRDKQQDTKKPISLKSKTSKKSVESVSEMSPGKRRALEAKQRLAQKNSFMARHRANSEKRHAQTIASHNLALQQAANGTPTVRSPIAGNTPTANTQQQTKKRIVVRKRDDSDTSNVPKPIFKNFR